MLVEPTLKILIHIKYHDNALHFDALFFAVILVAFSKAESQCYRVPGSVTYETKCDKGISIRDAERP